MNVLFVVTGVGYGDATREDANIRALLKRFPDSKVMVACYDNSLKYFKNKHPTIEIKGYQFSDEKMEFTVPRFILKNYHLPFAWAGSTWKIKRKIKKFKPDVIVSDFEPIGVFLSKWIKKPCIVVFGYDPKEFSTYPKKFKNEKLMLEAAYFEQIYKMANKVIIPSLSGAGRRKGKFNFINPVVRMKPSELPVKSRLMKKLKLEREPFLVMLGGSKFGNILAKKICRFAPLFDEDFIICGGADKAPVCSANVKHYVFKENFFEYLKVCKGVITLGGFLTLSECLAYKKPMMIFPIKDHVEQVLNAYTLRTHAHVHKSLRNFGVKLKKFMDACPVLKEKIPKLKFNGADQVVDIISETVEDES